MSMTNRLFESLYLDNSTAVTANHSTEFAMGIAGKYTAADPALADGKWSFLRVTSDGKLMVDTELTLTGVTIDNVKVFSTDGTVANAKYAKVNASLIPYALITNTDATASAVPKAGNTVAVADVALPVADANVLAAIVASSIAVPTTIAGATQTVTTAGVRVALAGSTAIKTVSIRASSTNAGTIYVGGVTVTSANGIALVANDQTEFNIANLATVYIDASLDAQSVGFTYFN